MSDQNILQICLEKQIDELEMLASIFCGAGELRIDVPGTVDTFHAYLQGQLTPDDLISKLSFEIRFEHSNEKVCLNFDLPHLYPLIEIASVTIRSVLFNKFVENLIKTKLDEFVQSLDRTEVYCYQVILWIQENIDEFTRENLALNQSLPKNDENSRVELERLWIYSHHIKSKTKRQEIVRCARELNLSGFLRSGKPGIICVEGLKSDTDEFWKIIRAMQWQKITKRKNEIKLKNPNDLDDFRKFSQFREEMFTQIETDCEVGDKEKDLENGDTNEQLKSETVKMDMSLFIKFLEKHNCGYMKKDLFGIE